MAPEIEPAVAKRSRRCNARRLFRVPIKPRLRGSIAAEGSPRIGRISTERRSHSCASPQSASCSENSAIRPEVSGPTLIKFLLSAPHFVCHRFVRQRETRHALVCLDRDGACLGGDSLG